MCVCAHEKEKTERGKWKETKSKGEEHRAERVRAPPEPLEPALRELYCWSLVTGVDAFPVCLNWISHTCNKGILARRQFAVVPRPRSYLS